jgi:hypothetical protein
VALSCLLFYRWPPAKLTIAILPNHVIVMDQEHHAFAISRRREYPPTSLPSGKLDDINKKDSFSQASKDAVDADEHDLKVEKCLAYHGARIDPRYFNVSGQGKNDCTIIALRQFNVIIVGSARTTTGAQCAHAHPEIASAGVISPSKEGTRNVLLLLDQQRRSVKSADGLAASVLQSYHPEIVVLQDGSKRLSSSCHFDLPHNYQQNNCADVQIEHSSDIRLRTFVSVCR